MAEKQEIDIRLFRKLFNGEVGHVVDHIIPLDLDKDEDDNDEDRPVFVFEKTGDKVRLLEEGFEINGTTVGVAECLGGYDDRVDPEDDDSAPKFTFDVDNFVLCMESGYRGEGCYWALYYDEENKRWLAVDLVSDGVVYTLE